MELSESESGDGDGSVKYMMNGGQSPLTVCFSFHGSLHASNGFCEDRSLRSHDYSCSNSVGRISRYHTAIN